MNSELIEHILKDLKVDSLGRIRGKNTAINRIQSEHLKVVDNALTDVRIFVAKLSTGHSSTEVLKAIDEFIYKKQLS